MTDISATIERIRGRQRNTVALASPDSAFLAFTILRLGTSGDIRSRLGARPMPETRG